MASEWIRTKSRRPPAALVYHKRRTHRRFRESLRLGFLRWTTVETMTRSSGRSTEFWEHEVDYMLAKCAKARR